MTPINTAITNAVAAHALWKHRLKEAIQKGTSEWKAASVQVDNACEFGKWLYGLPEAERKSPHFESVRRLHAGFHREAAAVLRSVEAGKRADAEEAMDIGGAFFDASARLTAAMMTWRKTVGE